MTDALPDWWTRAEREPEALALTDGTRRRSFAELRDRALRTAHLLRDDLGLGPDDHAALLVGNRVEGVEVLLGAILAGVWLTPVNRHLTQGEVAYVLRDSGARAVVTDPEHAELARSSGAKDVLVAGASLDAALAEASDAPLDLDGPAGANMIYTSGTTGRPKGVRRARPGSLRRAFAAQRAYGRDIGLDGSGPHLVTGPLYHAAPLMFAVYDLANGAPIVILPRFDARGTLRALREHAVRHTHLVPTMFVRLLALPDEERAAFRAPELDLVLHGAAPVSVAVKRRMLDWWGPVLVEYWGGTEGGVSTLADAREWELHPGTVGRAVRGFEVFAVGEDGRRLPPGAPGRLYARHESGRRVFAYHGDPEKTERAHLPDGSFTLGDVGCVDAEGFVHLQGRDANVVISGGVNVYPAEVEGVLAEHPAVADAAVFGIPDDEWGERVHAAVELAPGHEPSPALADAIRAFARERVAGYKVPRSLEFEAELPRTPDGKLRVRALRDRHWQGRDRRI